MYASLAIVAIFTAMNLGGLADRQLLGGAGIACAILCAILCALARQREDSPGVLRRAIVGAGDSSYSIYLTHSFMVGPASRAWGMVFGNSGVAVFVVLMLAGALVLGRVVYRHVEQPALRFMRRHIP
jgi:exopolysaccharide production protein ExoZ